MPRVGWVAALWCVMSAGALAQVAAPPPPAMTAPASPSTDALALLSAHPLRFPVEGIDADKLRDTFGDGRPGHRHEALDIPAPRGTRVVAVDDGPLVKLFTSKAGGLTVYQFDPSGRLAYYYAHLDRYADGLQEGKPLRRGDLIGYVGTTGNAPPDAPHLHFAVFLLGPQKQWWKGEALNPYQALRQAR
ncbi:M23 family metallopeptidase [Variovorax sp. dw_308]|uniref:M23 family metallopeptidase n=1 Tax=Variovorax sp. dw_308 TaxID=2721546 RepID=UPI00210C664F|nr:M23 family metallopeptidase [Variovorax sp. dw_308]